MIEPKDMVMSLEAIINRENLKYLEKQGEHCMSEWTHREGTEGIKKQAQELIDQAYQRGKSTMEFKAQEIHDKGYAAGVEQGRNEAWEAARKIISAPSDGGYKCEELQNIFGFDRDDYVISGYNATEAINKINEYEEQKKHDSEIRVGDEVYFADENHTRVVTCIYQQDGESIAVQITENGKWCVDNVTALHKTGRNFSQVEDILKNMRRE